VKHATTPPERRSRPDLARPSHPLCRAREAIRDVVAVAGLDLTINTRECFGLLGPNGAGKTTTIEILEGLTAPDRGEVEVLGMRWTGVRNARALRERLGIQLQDTQLAEKLTVEETVRLFRSFYRASHSVEEVLGLVGLRQQEEKPRDFMRRGVLIPRNLICRLQKRTDWPYPIQNISECFTIIE